MTKKLNKLNSNPGNKTNHVDNFTELNFKEVNIGGNKIAWTFAKVNIDENSGQLGGRYGSNSFYIKTASGNIYKVFKPTYDILWGLTKGDDSKCNQILGWPQDWCIFNPQTRKITAVENSTITCGESFNYAPKCTTSPIKEIVGVSGGTNDVQPSLKSTIEQDFIKKMQ